MLLITRRSGEGIVINGSIEVKILEVRGGRVKLGFEYPAGNTVYRQEVFTKIQAENRAAAGATQTATLEPAQLGTVLASFKANAKPKEGKEHDDHRKPGRKPDGKPGEPRNDD